MIPFIENISSFLQNKPKKRPSFLKGGKAGRRKATRDRRRSVNDGIIVNLTSRKERRSGYDRRKA
ncbi:MAG: hypothetical protein ACQES8_01890 [Thermodesulfobacteriota bacterium]